MSATTTSTAASTAASAAPAAAPSRVTKVRFGMRGKMLSAFAVAFTIVFGLLALFIMAFVTDQAQTKLTLQLQQTASGGAATLDAAGLTTLLAKHPTYNANDKWLCGGLTGEACLAKQDELYKAMNKELADIRTIVPNASPYTYFRDAADGQLHWLTSWSALNPDPNFTVPTNPSTKTATASGSRRMFPSRMPRERRWRHSALTTRCRTSTKCAPTLCATSCRCW